MRRIMRTVTYCDVALLTQRRRLQVRQWLATALDNPRTAARVHSVTFLPGGWMLVRTVLFERNGTVRLRGAGPAVQRQVVRSGEVPPAVRQILGGAP